jgi:hypothetical protein
LESGSILPSIYKDKTLLFGGAQYFAFKLGRMKMVFEVRLSVTYLFLEKYRSWRVSPVF